MSLAVGDETAKEHPEGLAGTAVGIITVVFNDVKFVRWIAQVNTPTKWKKGESLNSRHRMITNINFIIIYWLPDVYLKNPLLSCYSALFGESTSNQLESVVSRLVPLLKVQNGTIILLMKVFNNSNH